MSKKDDPYKFTLDKLVGFIEDAGFDEIVIHQFSFLALYFPVYMVLVDIKEKLGASVKFSEPIENDEKLIEEMMLKKFESFEIGNGNKTLNIGLCEPVLFNIPGEDIYKGYTALEKNGGFINECKLKKDESFFIHLPFINIPHVYGVALKNRAVINKIKRIKRDEGNKNSITIINFWEHFAAKLNLLDKSDFKDLVVSLYPKGSTTDRLIRDMEFTFKGTTWVDSVENEFEDLFKGIVDVAFTVQPWAAISASEKHNPPLDIEIVYKHAGRVFSFSSLILHTLKKEYLILGDFILNCFSKLLKLKIDDLYKKESRDLDDDINRYCNLVYAFCNSTANNCRCACCAPNKCDNTYNDFEMREGCAFETKMAVRLINDSQIYKRGLGDLKEEKMREASVVADYFVKKFGYTFEGHEKFQELMRTEV